MQRLPNKRVIRKPTRRILDVEDFHRSKDPVVVKLLQSMNPLLNRLLKGGSNRKKNGIAPHLHKRSPEDISYVVSLYILWTHPSSSRFLGHTHAHEKAFLN